VRPGPLALIALALALAVGGCGAAKHNPAALRLQREDLIATSRALAASESSVERELTAAKAAWPLVATGLPGAPTIALPAVGAAAASATKVAQPALFGEAQARSLTGPASKLASLFRDYTILTQRGWQLIAAAIDQIQHGSRTVARFARANVALYIDSVYDGHFELAQIGKKLRAAYQGLGGPAAFAGSLTRGEVAALARAYSEATARLRPHVRVQLGS
jgi:hypothetical protein